MIRQVFFVLATACATLSAAQAATITDEAVASAVASFPARFLNTDCQREPVPGEGAMSVCFANEQVIAGGSILLGLDALDKEGLTERLRRAVIGDVGYAIISESSFDVPGKPNSLNLRGVYKSSFGIKHWWGHWHEGRLTRVLVNERDMALPSDIHQQVIASFFTDSAAPAAPRQAE